MAEEEAKRSTDNYDPPMSPYKKYDEVNSYVMFWGLLFSSIFTLAVGYLCLKIGQAIGADAPVTVLAMGMAVVFHRKEPFPEIVHIQSISTAGTSVLCGAMFILPALYILGIHDVTFIQMAIPVITGGILGVLIGSALRRYFCEEMHLVYPFPGSRASAELLQGNDASKAHIMLISGAVGMVYDFILNALGWWQEVLSTTTFAWGQALADRYKLVFSLDSDVAIVGIGYFTGLRYAAIIAAGSFFSYLVCIPVVYFIGGEHVMTVGGQQILLAHAPVEAVFSQYVRHVGIGMLAMAGIIGLFSMFDVVLRVIRKAMGDLFARSKSRAAEAALLRTQRDIPMRWVVIGTLAMTLIFAIFFHVTFAETLFQTVLAFLLVLLFSLILSIIAISSIAYTNNEPVSGMTIFMIIVSSVVMAGAGLQGKLGIVVILIMASFVCSALAMAGNVVGVAKVGYITGATPKKMEINQLIAVVVTGLVSVGVLLLVNHAYSFTGPDALAAPQANAMAAIVGPMMTGGEAPWPLYMAGAFFAILLWMMRVPPLVFALGAYLPMSINLPLLVGGILSYIVSHGSKDAKVNALRLAEGNTVASGLIAGGTIGSLFSTVLHIAGFDWFAEAWAASPMASVIGLIAYLILCIGFCSIVKRAAR